LSSISLVHLSSSSPPTYYSSSASTISFHASASTFFSHLSLHDALPISAHSSYVDGTIGWSPSLCRASTTQADSAREATSAGVGPQRASTHPGPGRPSYRWQIGRAHV